ncbi:ethanolamine ammonia-lyase subunit EutB [Shigella sonnei]
MEPFRPAHQAADFPEYLRQRKRAGEFGVELAMLDEARAVGADITRIAGEKPLNFRNRTRLGAIRWRELLGADQVTMEARNYGLARHYDPFYRQHRGRFYWAGASSTTTATLSVRA